MGDVGEPCQVDDELPMVCRDVAIQPDKPAEEYAQTRQYLNVAHR